MQEEIAQIRDEKDRYKSKVEYFQQYGFMVTDEWNETSEEDDPSHVKGEENKYAKKIAMLESQVRATDKLMDKLDEKGVHFQTLQEECKKQKQ